MIVTGALAVVIAAGMAALADGDRVHLSIFRDQRGTAACPDDDMLTERVRARLGSEPFRDDELGREVRVGIARKGGGLEARIAMFAPNGTRLGLRILSGPADCVALADDLVLAVAIAVDPLLLVRRPAVAVPLDGGGEGAAASSRGAGRATENDDSVAVPETVAPESVERAVVRAPAAFPVPAPASIGVRGAIRAAGGVGLVAHPSVGAEVSLDYGVLRLDAGARFDLPARYPIPGSATAVLDASLIAAALAPCLAWDVDAAVRVRGCAVGEVGMFQVQGIGVLFPGLTHTVTAPWLAGGVRGALDVQVLPPLGVVFEADLLTPALSVELVDDATRQPLADANHVAWALGVGLEIQ